LTDPATAAAAASAAADAWLDHLSLADRLAAQAHTDTRLAVWFGAGAVVIAAAALISRLGTLTRIAAMLEARGPRPWLTSAACAILAAALLALATALYDLLVAAPLDGVVLSPREALAGIAPVISAAMILVPALQWLFRVRPRTGPILAGTVAVGLCLAAGWGSYAFNANAQLPPAPPGAVTEGLQRLITESGIPADGVRLSPDPGFDADVTGGFGHASVVIGRQVLAWDPDEARAFVGHVMGHYVHGDVFALFLVDGLVAFAALFAIQLYAAPLARILGARGVESASDPEAIPAASILLVLAFAAATLAGNGYLRWANVRADDYSLAHAGDPQALAQVLERRWDHEGVDPNPIERWVFYSHPPLRPRLTHAMRWELDHGQ
jgi:STE24 endopeptidase